MNTDDQIAELESQIDQIHAARASLVDATAASQEALTAALRKYAVDPSSTTQERVDQCEERLKACRRRQHTTADSLKIIQADLAALKAQRETERKARETAARAAAVGGLRAELADIKVSLREQAIRYAALMHVCEGNPTGTVSIGAILDAKARQAAQDAVVAIKQEWRDG